MRLRIIEIISRKLQDSEYGGIMQTIAIWFDRSRKGTTLDHIQDKALLS